MTVQEAIEKAFLHATRKATAPAAGTSKHDALLAIADSVQKMWAAEETDWDSLYSLVTIGTVTATDEFELDDTIDYISPREGDSVLLTNGTNTQTVKLVSPQQLYEARYDIAAARIGTNLKFSKTFASTDSTFGYDIKVPAFLIVDDITSATQDIQVDDPMWAVYMMAAEYVRNDAVKSDQYASLIDLAKVHMDKMKQRNGGQNDAVVMTAWIEGESWL